MARIRTSAAALLTGLALTLPVTAAVETASAAPTSKAPTSSATAPAVVHCHSSFRKYHVIKKGSKGSQVRAMECALRAAGFPASVNRSFSAHDAAELARFRRAVGLEATKVGDRRAWSALLSRGTRPALSRGDHGGTVLRLQRSLQAVGWTTIDLNSRFDAKTVRVVKAAQKQRHLSRTGRVTPALWSALQHGKVAGPAKKKSSSRGAKALAFAKKQLGEPYRFGAAGPSSWDCSGLTAGAWKAAGVSLPHNAAAQFHRGHRVSKSNLRVGDLVFFYSGPSHVALYAGHGKVIHAPRPGSRVSYIKMSYMPFAGARRP